MDERCPFVLFRGRTLNRADDFQRGTDHIIKIYSRTAWQNCKQSASIILFQSNPALRVGRSGRKGNQRAADGEWSSGKAHEHNLIPEVHCTGGRGKWMQEVFIFPFLKWERRIASTDCLPVESTRRMKNSDPRAGGLQGVVRQRPRLVKILFLSGAGRI